MFLFGQLYWEISDETTECYDKLKRVVKGFTLYNDPSMDKIDIHYNASGRLRHHVAP